MGTPGWESDDAERAQRHYDELVAAVGGEGTRAVSSSCCARRAILIGEPRPITHAVKFYEKGDRPLEIVTSRQWFIKTIEFREALLERGRQLQWHPAYMQARYENWTNGLNGDWCISRQRFFGVPFPVWYPLDEAGRVVLREAAGCERGAAARRSVDRRARRISGRPARSSPAGFVGDPDVMDTWATSSLTPQIVCGWEDDADFFSRDVSDGSAAAGARHHPDVAVRHGPAFTSRARLPAVDGRRDFRMGARPRSQEDVEVQGQRRDATGAARRAWIGRRALLGGERAARHRYGVRHRADARRPPARDQAVERVALRAGDGRAARRRHLHRSIARCCATWQTLVAEATDALDDYDYARVLERAERSSGGSATIISSSSKGGGTGNRAPEQPHPRTARWSPRCRCICGCLHPFLPFVTEEVWSWWREGSVHRAAWPMRTKLHRSCR